MEKLKSFILDRTKEAFTDFKRIGGGYYADVYKVDYRNKDSLIVKVYKSEGIVDKEIAQIKLLSDYAMFPMPEVLWTHCADENFQKDILVMNCLKGENAGNVFYLSSSKRTKLAEQVVDNLLAFHNTCNPDGFGEINSERYYSTFNEYYKEKAACISVLALKLNKKGELSDYVMDVVNQAVKEFDKIFYLPITQSSLIHGDYNMWNILVDRKNCKVTAVIDPCGCKWADSEYDLYQLNNANGKHFKLFETYSKKKKLSENYREKMAFYELFTEIEHYYNSGYPVQKKLIKKQADNLKAYL